MRRPWILLLLLAVVGCRQGAGTPATTAAPDSTVATTEASTAAASPPVDAAPAAADAAPDSLAGAAPSQPTKGPPSWLTDPGPPQPKPPIDAAKVDAVQIDIYSETGYPDPKGGYILDLMERDYGYLTAELHTPEGRPVRGARLDVGTGSNHGSRLIMPEGHNGLSNDMGQIDFGIIAGKMGLDDFTLGFADAHVTIQVNVVSLAAAGVPSFEQLKDVVSWDKLMRAHFSYSNQRLSAKFLPEIEALNGKTVKIAGFMFPLETESVQKHFLLTANPPSCFFHIPGGPAGSVEVFAEKGISASFDPMILEGTLETRHSSDNGVIYRLLKAHESREKIQ